MNPLDAIDPLSPSTRAAEEEWVSTGFYFLKDVGNNCANPIAVRFNSRCGYLAYAKGSGTRTTWTIYGARSGNNRPEDDCVLNTGPINMSMARPRSDANYGRYTLGYRNRTWHERRGWQGFRVVDENNPSLSGQHWSSFKPGQFDLSPWDVPCPRARGAFQIHGGVNHNGKLHHYRDQVTQGCIRLSPESINSIRARWSSAPNKRSTPLIVNYSMA